MSEYHEPYEELDARVRDLHRALTSLKEEIEAVDWYTQRAARSSDPELRRILEHNRNEEIEHACMTLEWLRRTMPEWQDTMEKYLFIEGDIVATEIREEGKEAGASGGRASAGSRGRAPAQGGSGPGVGLGVGSLKVGSLKKESRR